MGADYNRADREATARLAERQRLEKFDLPSRRTLSATLSLAVV